MLGRNWLAMRTEDLLITARWLANEEGQASVRLAAYGELGPAAKHAAALEGDLIASLRVEGGLASWRQLMTSAEAYPHIHNAVHGVLRHYDLPDLEKLGLASRRTPGSAPALAGRALDFGRLSRVARRHSLTPPTAWTITVHAAPLTQGDCHEAVVCRRELEDEPR
jgi:hypothetical protein